MAGKKGMPGNPQGRSEGDRQEPWLALDHLEGNRLRLFLLALDLARLLCCAILDKLIEIFLKPLHVLGAGR